MKKHLTTLVLIFTCFNLYSQKKIDEEITTLVESKQYQVIIEKYGKASNNYSYQTLYNIGLSYYMLNDI